MLGEHHRLQHPELPHRTQGFRRPHPPLRIDQDPLAGRRSRRPEGGRYRPHHLQYGRTRGVSQPQILLSAPRGQDEQGSRLVLGQPGHVRAVARQQPDALLSHIVGGLTRAALVGEGDPDALARPAHVDGVPDDGRPAAYRAAAGRAASAWADDAKLDTLVEVPWGKVPGRFAIAGYIQEILAHGWDLARATGQETERDPELATWALATARRILPPDIRGSEDVPFGPVVEVSPDATPYAQLAAWLGRHP